MDIFQVIPYCYKGHPELIPYTVLCNYIIWASYLVIGGVALYLGLKSLKKKIRVSIPNNPYLWAHAGLFIVACGTDHLFDNFNLLNRIPVIGMYDAAYLALTGKIFTAFVSASFCILLLRIHDFHQVQRDHFLKMDKIKMNLFKTDIINNMPGMVFLVNKHGEFVDVNDKAAKVLGYRRGELQSKNFFDIIDSKYIEGTKKAYENNDVTAEFQFVFNEYLKKNGGNQDMYWINHNSTGGELVIAQAVEGLNVIDLSKL
ncbi:MAG: PAS domain S-box protein [Prolixibacteraceae bacterium]